MAPISIDKSALWQGIQEEARQEAEREPFLASYFHSTIIAHADLAGALSYLLSVKLADDVMPAVTLRELIEDAFDSECGII